MRMRVQATPSHISIRLSHHSDRSDRHTALAKRTLSDALKGTGPELVVTVMIHEPTVWVSSPCLQKEWQSGGETRALPQLFSTLTRTQWH